MFVTIILIIALLTFVFSMDLSWSNVVSAERNDLVFENRNTLYGAYIIRKEHHKNVFYALLLSVGLIGGSFLAISAFRNAPPPSAPPTGNETVIPFIDIPDIDNKPAKEVLPKAKKQISSGMEDREVIVVDNGQTKPIASDLDRHDKAQGTGDDDPIGIVEPYDPGVRSGSGTAAIVVVPKKEPKRFVRHRPQFPGGDAALAEFMAPRVRYSDMDIDRGVEGIIYITFIVNEDGSIRDIHIERGIRDGEALAKKAIKAINQMPPWTPGDDGEGPTPTIVTMPLKLTLRN